MSSLPVPVTTWYMVSPGSPRGSPTWSSGNTPSTLRALVASCCYQSQGCQTLFALSVHPAPLQLIPHVRSLLGGGHWPDLTPDIFLLFAITPCITTAKSCSPYSPARAQTTDHRPKACQKIFLYTKVIDTMDPPACCCGSHRPFSPQVWGGGVVVTVGEKQQRPGDHQAH